MICVVNIGNTRAVNLYRYIYLRTNNCYYDIRVEH